MIYVSFHSICLLPMPTAGDDGGGQRRWWPTADDGGGGWAGIDLPVDESRARARNGHLPPPHADSPALPAERGSPALGEHTFELCWMEKKLL
jgi:hypothetical protein